MNMVEFGELALEKERLEAYIDFCSFDKGHMDSIKPNKERLAKLNDELLFYTEYENFYKLSDELHLNKELLYPYKVNGELDSLNAIDIKAGDTLKEDTEKFIESVNNLHEDRVINEKTKDSIIELAIELSKKQINRLNHDLTQTNIR